MRLFIWIFFLSLFLSVECFAKSSDPIFEILKAHGENLFPFLEPSERSVAEQIKTFTKSESISEEVLAFNDKDTGTPVIAFNPVALGKYNHLAESLCVAQQIGSQNFVIGYMRYLARFHEFLYRGGKFLSPVEFAKYYGLKVSDPETYQVGTPLFNCIATHQTSILAFVFAHETAHHILGHTDKPKVTKKERRKREIAADTWAINLLTKAGYISTGPIFLALYYNEKKNRDLPKFSKDGEPEQFEESSHPAGITRALILTSQMIKSLNKWGSQLKKRYSDEGLPFDHERIVQKLKRFNKVLLNQFFDQAKAGKDPTYWEVLAGKGDKLAMQKVAVNYSHALNNYYPDWEKSISWHKKVVHSSNTFDYVAVAYSEYALGVFYAFHKKQIAKNGRNLDLAKKYLLSSAEKGYDLAKITLDALDRIEE